MAEPPTYIREYLGMAQTPLYVNIGVAQLPHPFKTADGVGGNQQGTMRRGHVKC